MNDVSTVPLAYTVAPNILSKILVQSTSYINEANPEAKRRINRKDRPEAGDRDGSGFMVSISA
jgi:hypothetical protein